MDARISATTYRFDAFTLDLRRGVLLVDGTERALRPKSFRLFRHLAENADRLISRDEIMQVVWPGTFVTEDSITQCIREIRRALNDDAQTILRTVTRRGYLLVGPPLRPENSGPDEAPTATAAPQKPGPLPPPPTGRPMVIVLPFQNIGGDAEQGYFADGLTADLMTDLTRFQELHIAGPSRHEHALTNPDLSAAARYVLGGSVRRTGGRIRITAQLRDGATDISLWAERFDRPLEELFALQEDLTNRIAASVSGQVGRESLRRLRRRPPASLDAYDLYLHGRELHDLTTEADTLVARRIFDRAIAADPDYAPAYAYQAYTVQRGFTLGWGEPRGCGAMDLALSFASRAVELEPESSLCMIRLANVLALLGRHEEAVETASRAARANPCDAASRATYGEVLSMAGFHDTGVAQLRIALSLNPFHPPFWWATLGRALTLAGQPQEALSELRRCVVRAPDYRPCHSSMVLAYVETGQIEKARESMGEYLRLRPGWVIRNYDGVFGLHQDADIARFLNAFRAASMPEN